MQAIGVKTDDIGDTLSAVPFNQNLRFEPQNLVTSAGFTLDPEGDLVNAGSGDFARSVAVYASTASSVYVDVSTSANTYKIQEKSVLVRRKGFYTDGQLVLFQPLFFDNTGACQVIIINDQTGLTKSLTHPDGSAIQATEIIRGYFYLIRYNGDQGRWELIFSGRPKMALKHISGLVPENSTGDFEHDITISPGEARASNLNYSMELTSPLTKEIDGLWEEGNNAGGRWNTPLDPYTWYHLALILKDDGTIDAIFYASGSGTAPASLPPNYIVYRRLGSVLTDIATNIEQYITLEKGQSVEYFWKSLKIDLPIAAILTTYPFLIPVSVPPDLRVLVQLGMRGQNTFGSDRNITVTSPETTDTVFEESSTDLYLGPTTEKSKMKHILTNTTSEVKAFSNAISNQTRLGVWTISFIEPRP